MAKLEKILRIIGKRIAYYCEQKGMNQSQLAKELDKDRQVIQKLETGRLNPTIKTLSQISIVLGIEVADLLK